MRRSGITAVAVCIAFLGQLSAGAAHDREALLKVRTAIETRRTRASAIAVSGVTTRMRTVDRETNKELPEPEVSDAPFMWIVDIRASRFRLEESTPRIDPTDGSSFELETVMAFDGAKGVLWHPQRTIMSDGTPYLDAGKMSAENDFLMTRIFGPVFWWLGILDDYDALISGKHSDLNAYQWSQTADGGEVIATIRNGEREEEFVFSAKHDYNIVRATSRLHRAGHVLTTSSATVTYEQRDGLLLPVVYVREISSGVDSTEFTSWDLVPELPIEATQLPTGFLKPGMLITDDQVSGILQISEQGTPVPRLPGAPLPDASFSRRTVFLSVAVVAAIIVAFMLVRRSRSA